MCLPSLIFLLFFIIQSHRHRDSPLHCLHPPSWKLLVDSDNIAEICFRSERRWFWNLNKWDFKKLELIKQISDGREWLFFSWQKKFLLKEIVQIYLHIFIYLFTARCSCWRDQERKSGILNCFMVFAPWRVRNWKQNILEIKTSLNKNTCCVHQHFQECNVGVVPQTLYHTD